MCELNLTEDEKRIIINLRLQSKKKSGNVEKFNESLKYYHIPRAEI